MRKLRDGDDSVEDALKRPPNFRLRQMTEADLPAVMKLEEQAFSNPWSAELLKRELDHEWSTILLVEEVQGGGGLRPVSDPSTGEGVELVGLCIFWVVHDEVHILNVATAMHHRRRGVARTVIAETLARGRKRGCTLATLEVRRSNEPALQLYKGFGFRPVGVRPNYYAEEREDAIVMVMDL